MAQSAEIVLNARNRTRRAFQAAERDARRAAENIRKPFAGLEGTMGKAGLALTAFGAVGGALVVKSALLAARVQTLGVVVESVGKIAGYSASEMRGFVDAVAAQGITVQASRTAVIKLTQANIDLSKASKLARIAQDAAVIAGIDSSQAFERMIHGITTLNPLILRKLGIIVNLEGEYTKLAKATNRSSSELSGLEKQMIATEAVMSAGERIVGTYEAAMTTAGKALTSIPRHIEEARVALGETFLPLLNAVVRGLTDMLKAFNSMPKSAKQFAGLMMGVGVAVASTVGPLLFMMSLLPGLASNLVLVGSKIRILARAQSIFTAGSAPFSAAIGGMSAGMAAFAAAAVAALAIIAVTVAIAKLVQFAITLKGRMDDVNDAIVAQNRHMLDTARTYDEYRIEMESVGRVTDRWVGTQEEMNEEIERLKASGISAGQALGRYRNAIILASTEDWRRKNILEGLSEAEEEATRRVRDHIPAVVDLMTAEDLLARELERVNELYKGMIDELNFIVGIDFGKDIMAHSETIEDLTSDLTDLQDELATLEGSWRAGTPTGQKEIASMKERIEGVNEALDKESLAWKENTAQLIFNMAQRALASLPIEAQFTALSGLAERLGLVDEETAKVWEEIGRFTAMLASGEIIEAQYIGFLDALLGRYADMPENVTTTVTTQFQTLGTPFGGIQIGAGGGALPGRPTGSQPPPTGAAPAAIVGPSGSIGFQHGGRVAKGARVLAGEEGLPELFVPDSAGRIFSNSELQRAGGARAPGDSGGSGEAVKLLKDILAVLGKSGETVQINITEGQEEQDLEELALQILTLIKFRKTI